MAENATMVSRSEGASDVSEYPQHAASSPRLGEVEVDGATVRYRLWDQAGPNAPGLLFAHGYRAHARWWDHIAPAFLQDYRVAALDFTGFGDSDWRETYSARIFARELLAVADDAGLSPVTVVAHSFGGTPAAHAARLAPDKVRRVIIIDSRMLIPVMPEPDRLLVDLLGRPNQVFDKIDALMARFRLLPPVEAVDPRLLDHIARHSIRSVEGGWAWKFDPRLHPLLGNDPDRFVPKDVPAPLNFIYGERSDTAPPDLVRLISDYFDSGEPIVIPGANHHVPLEKPAALIEALKTILAAKA